MVAAIIASMLSYVGEILTENVTYILDARRGWGTICTVGAVAGLAGGFLTGSNPSVSKQAAVAIRVDAACSVYIDGKLLTKLESGQMTTTNVRLGTHIVEAVSSNPDAKWEKKIEVADSKQILVETELAPRVSAALLEQKGRELAANAKWLLGTWTRSNADDYRGGNDTCSQYYDYSSEMKVYIKDGQVVGSVNARGTSVFPNTRYQDVCEEDRRRHPDFSESFSFVVTSFSGQSASLRLSGEISCNTHCENLRNNYRRYSNEWKLEAKPDDKIHADFVSNEVNGDYSR